MTTASTIDVAQIRAQLTSASMRAESAFDRAFDLQQAGAPAERVDAALAEVNRLQGMVRQLQEQLADPTTLH